MNLKAKLITTGVVGASAVIFGAFGAHALKEIISEQSLEVYKTGVQYHFYHVVLLAILSLNSKAFDAKLLNRAFVLFLLGILLFSGSLYLLAVQYILGINIKWLGPITPIGGLCFIIGWIYFILLGLKYKG